MSQARSLGETQELEQKRQYISAVLRRFTSKISQKTIQKIEKDLQTAEEISVSQYLDSVLIPIIPAVCGIKAQPSSGDGAALFAAETEFHALFELCFCGALSPEAWKFLCDNVDKHSNFNKVDYSFVEYVDYNHCRAYPLEMVTRFGNLAVLQSLKEIYSQASFAHYEKKLDQLRLALINTADELTTPAQLECYKFLLQFYEEFSVVSTTKTAKDLRISEKYLFSYKMPAGSIFNSQMISLLTVFADICKEFFIQDKPLASKKAAIKRLVEHVCSKTTATEFEEFKAQVAALLVTNKNGVMQGYEDCWEVLKGLQGALVDEAASKTPEELKAAHEPLMKSLADVEADPQVKNSTFLRVMRLNSVLENFYMPHWQTPKKLDECSWLPRKLHLRSLSEMFRAYHYDATRPLDSSYLQLPPEVKAALGGITESNCFRIQRKFIQQNKYHAFIAAIKQRKLSLQLDTEEFKRTPACQLALMAVPPNLLDFKHLPFKEDEAYVGVGDKLYYVNKLTGECIHLDYHSPLISSSQKDALSALLARAASGPIPLDSDQLSLIQTVSGHSREKSSDNIFCALWDLLKSELINRDQIEEIFKLIQPYELGKAVAANDEKALVNALWQALVTELLPLVGEKALQLPFSSLVDPHIFPRNNEKFLGWNAMASSSVAGHNSNTLPDELASGLLPLCFQLAQPPKNLNALEQRAYKEQIILKLHNKIDQLCKNQKTAPLFPDKFALVKKILHVLSHVIGVGFAIGYYNRKHYGTYFKADATKLTVASLDLKERVTAVSKVMRPRQ